jgi:hypothetical protein
MGPQPAGRMNATRRNIAEKSVEFECHKVTPNERE